MMKPAVLATRSALRNTALRCMSFQTCDRVPPMKIQTSQKRQRPGMMSLSKRHFHHPTEKNVITSQWPDVDIPNSLLNDFLWTNLDLWPDRTAVVCGITGRGYTYVQLHRMCTAFAASLRNKLKLRDGDCVAVMLPNSPEFPIASLGGVQAGCVVTTVNPIYVNEEIARQLDNSKAKVLVTTKECYPEVLKAFELLKRRLPVMLTECNGSVPEGAIDFAEFAENFAEDTDCLKEVRRTPEDIVFMPYSSGTTGLPKGVELSHRNIISNCLQMTGGHISIFSPATPNHQDITICVLPFFHIYGLVVTFLTSVMSGAKMVTVPKFLPETYLNAQEKYMGNVLFIVPPIVLFLTSHKSVKKIHLDPIRTLMSGAAPLAATDVHRFLERVNNSNVAFMQGYGLTETSPVCIMQERGNPNYASVGHPTPNTDAKIIDLENENNSLGPNKVGELLIRGPQVMKGYFENPEANKDIFRPGGWMRTGDLAYYDENDYFYITDRLKELIKVKGYQVPPAELEAVLRSHPELSDAAVIGVPHEHYGEIPKAFVVKKDGYSPSAESVMEFVAKKVSSYKRLGDLMFVESIPKNASGKILRREVRAKFT